MVTPIDPDVVRRSSSRRTAACRCTSAGCSCSRSPRAPGAATAARCTSRCATSTRSRRCSSSTPPLARDRRPAGLGRGRAVRHRPPRPAQRAAQARPDPRAARPERPPARHPAGLGAAAVGGARHRGAARRPGGDVHQDPPRPRRRHLGDAAGAEHPQHRPGRARDAARRGAREPSSRAARPKSDRGLAEIPISALRTALGHHRRGRGHAGRADQDPHQERAQRDLVAVALRAPHDLQPADHRLAPVRRPGLADRAAARRSARPPAPR